MKRLLLILCFAGAAILVLLLWPKNRRVLPERHATPTFSRAEGRSVPGPANNTPGPSRVKPESPAQAFPSSATNQEVPNSTEGVLSHAYDEWRTPISFYGKVVDENTNPVAGAEIHFVWTDLSQSGSSERTTTSDHNGLFSLQDVTGKALSVQVSKQGYYAYKNYPVGFFYAGENENFVPDPASPVVFRLKKMGQLQALHNLKKSYKIPRDGTPLRIDLETGKSATGEAGGALTIRCWTADAGKRRGERYDWHCQLNIPEGGLVLSDKEFDFEAPETGYVASTEITMPADRPDWKNDVDLKLFYRLHDGRYGRMIFSMIAGGQHFCMIDSVLNPTGSRNLEPSN